MNDFLAVLFPVRVEVIEERLAELVARAFWAAFRIAALSRLERNTDLLFLCCWFSAHKPSANLEQRQP